MFGCSILRTILHSACGLAVLLGGGSAAVAATPTLRFDLPPGSLGSAIASLAEKSDVSIGTFDAGLMAIQLPALHLEGSAAAVLANLAHDAGVTLVRTGPNGWRIKRAPPPPPPPPKRAEPPRATVTQIVVQATKRAELLSDYPAEIVRITGGELDRYGGVPNSGGLSALAPILTATDWGGGQEKLFLRGIADSSYTGASPALVGEYLGDRPLVYDAPDPDLRLYDVASVEVLPGPQGTLYGSGALAGVIRIEPNAPNLDTVSGSIWAGDSSTAHGAAGGDIGGIVNLPLVEGRLALRAVGYAANDGGYIDDVERGLTDVNETLTRGGRVLLRWVPADDWTVDFGGVIQRIANRDAPYANPDDPAWTRSSPFAQPSSDTFASGDVTVGGRIGGVDIRSTTGFVEQSIHQRFQTLPLDQVTGKFDAAERPRQVSQELRLSGGAQNTTWVMGVNYLAHWEAMAQAYSYVARSATVSTLRDRTGELTGYGEVTQRFGALSITLGLRYAAEDQAGGFTSDASVFRLAYAAYTSVKEQERHLLPSGAASYKVTPDTTLFVREGSGVRLGGLNATPGSDHYGSDHITTVEAGLRHSLGDDRLVLSATGAYSLWRDIQADLLDGAGAALQIANIGAARITSLDTSLALRLVEGLTLDASGFVVSSRLDPAPILAQPSVTASLPDVARSGGTAALDYRGLLLGRRPFQIGLRVQHIGPSLLVLHARAAEKQGDYTTVALGGGLRFGGASAQLSVQNLLDSRGDAFAIGSPFVVASQNDITPVRPRTLRLGVRYDF